MATGYADGRLGTFNPAFQKLIGYSEEELKSVTWNETLTPPEWRQYEAEKIAELNRTRAPAQYEKEFVHKNGSRIAVELVVHPFFDDRGNISSYYAFISDITKRKRAEKAILQAKEEWELTFNTVPDLMMILDKQHRIVRVNKATADRLGLAPEQCIGVHCYEAVHGLSHPPEFCPHALTCQDGKEHSTDVHEPRLGGDFLVSTTPMLDGNGMLIGSIHVARDITERKRAELRLHERTAELEAANRELEAFSYSVSHDLRAPLRHMDGFSRLVLEGYSDKLDNEGKEYLQIIRNSSELMARLIDDLLNLSRIARTEITREKVNLSELAGKVSGELKRTQPEREVDFVIRPRLEAYGDNQLLKLVFDNLLGNAFKFTGKCPRARIEFGLSERNGEKVFFVRDNGVGFDMTYVDKLFKPFQRLHKAGEFPGTGIGLASAHRIISRLGGRIWAEGEMNKGATFYFTLPQISNGGSIK